MPKKRPEDHLPLKAVHHMALLILAQEPTYGVALMERLEERSSGAIRLNAGSLYRIIGSLKTGSDRMLHLGRCGVQSQRG